MTPGPTPGLRALALYKFGLGLLLCAVAFELIHLLGRDLVGLAHEWVIRLHADPHNPIVIALRDRVEHTTAASLEEYAAVAGLFGVVHLVESVGLWWRKHWAEYLCIGCTALFVPLEVYEVLAQPEVTEALMLATNVLIIWYLVRQLRRQAGAR